MSKEDKRNKIHNLLDLFAGCGGMSQGFEMAGFRIVGANDIWEDARKTYERNHPETKFISGDITEEKVRLELIRLFDGIGCDVIIGGPPCQAYSMSGGRDVDDPRGFLFESYVEIVRELEPKIFVMENVTGILTIDHDKEGLDANKMIALNNFKKVEKERAALMLKRKQSKNTEKIKFDEEDSKRLEIVKSELRLRAKIISGLREKVTERILRRFKEIGYTVAFKTLNAADYGVPQKRERVIFIGTQGEIPIKFPQPTHGPKEPIKQEDLFLNSKKPWVTVREAIDDLKDLPENLSINHILPKHGDEFTLKIINTPIGKSVFRGYSDAFYKNPPDEPSRTIKENHGGVLVHYEKPRVMTPRELARLQSFPDDFIFEGSKSSVLKQIGNAVPPLLARGIALAVKESLTNGQQEKDH